MSNLIRAGSHGEYVQHVCTQENPDWLFVHFLQLVQQRRNTLVLPWLCRSDGIPQSLHQPSYKVLIIWWNCLLEFQARHICHDLFQSKGDVVDLFVQEYWLLDALPLKSVNPIWHIAPWPEAGFLGQESIESFSRVEVCRWDSYITLHQSWAGLRRDKISSKAGAHISKWQKKSTKGALEAFLLHPPGWSGYTTAPNENTCSSIDAVLYINLSMLKFLESLI